MCAVQFDVRTVSEDNCLSGVKIGNLVGIAPQDVEARGRVEPGQTMFAAVAPNFLRQTCQDTFKDDCFDLHQEPGRRYFLTVGVLDSGESGEGAEARPDAGDNKIRP